MARQNNLGTDKIGPLVWRIAIPSMLAQFVSVLYSIVDRINVGHIPEVGDLALAGIGVCGPIVTMIGAFAFWIGIGGAPLMSISMGEERPERAKQILGNCAMLLVVLSVVLTGVVLAVKEPMLRAFGASGASYPYAVRYFTIYVSGTIFALLSTGLNQFIIAQGNAKAGMVSVIIGAIMNIALDPVFIFVLDMGVAGAAYATIISQACSMVFVVWFLLKRAQVRLSIGSYQLKIIGKVLLLGISPFLIISMDNVMIIALNALMQKFGGPEQGDILITTNAIVQSFMLILTMPLGGISGGTQSILSFNYGARQSKRVMQASYYIMALCAGFSALMFVTARVAGPQFVSLFTQDPVIAAQAVRAIKICTLLAAPLGIQYAIVDGFTAMGLVRFSLPLSLWRKFSYFLAVFTIPFLFGIENIFYAEPFSDFMGPLVSVTLYLLVMKKTLKKREELQR